MEDKETIVIDVQIDENDAAARLAEVNNAIKTVEDSSRRLKAEIKEGNDEFGLNAKQLAQNEVLLKSLKAEQSALSGQIRAGVQSYQKYGTSIKELTAKMNALKEEYRSLNREDRDSDIGQSLKQQISELRQEINEANHSLGDFQDNVGNYPGAIQPATEQLKELTKAIIEMKMAGKEGTEEYTEMVKKAGELKDAIGDTQQEIKQMASDTSNLDSVLQGAQVTAGAFSTALGVLNLVSDEDSESMKELADIQKKLQSAIAITTGLQSVQNALQKNSALMMGIQKIQTLAAAKAQDAYTSATGRATIAQRIFNAVAKSNPYVLLAMAILSVIGALVAFNKGEKETEEQTKKVNDELSSQIEVIKALRAEYETALSASIHEKENEIALLKARGANLKEIRDIEDEMYSLQAENFAQQKQDYAEIFENLDTYKERVGELSNEIKENADKQHEMYADLEKLQEGYFINFSKYPMLLGKAHDEQISILQQMYDMHISVGKAAIEEMETLQKNINTAESIQRAEDDATNKRLIQLEERRKEDQKRAKEAADKQAEITKKRNDELRKIEKDYNQFVIDELRNQVSDYSRCIDDEIQLLQHRLDTEKNLTISERAKLNGEIIQKELEKNEEIARMNRDLALIESKNTLEQQNSEIDERIAQLEKEGVITTEIRDKYEQQRKNNQVKYEEDIARIAEQYVNKVAEYRMQAEKETLENQEEELKLSYERREELRQIAAEKRMLEAGKDEEAAAQAELQNAIEEQAALLSLDAETKQALGMSQEQYELLVLESEKRIQEAKEKTIQTEQKKAAMQMKAIGDIFGGMTDILDEFSEENEELAGIEKMLSLAKIAMSTGVALAEGIAAAQAAGPYPANLVAIATTVAAIMANIASAISVVNSAKFAQGGIVPGNSYYGDKVPAQLNSGEMLLNREQQTKLFRMINQPMTSDRAMDFDQMVDAFSTALSEQPNPVLDYSEFVEFTNGVEQRTNKTIIK